MKFKAVVGDPKTKRTYQKEVETDALIGKKIGDVIPGDAIGLAGYELQITGGSDKDGFPMRKDIEGTRRVRALLSKGPGFRPKRKGEKRRKTVRGNTIAEDIVQINFKVVKWGEGNLEEWAKA